MAVGQLDIAVEVDATSAVAGFNKAAAANQKFLQSLLDASDPMRRISREMERLNAMQASGEASAEHYAQAMAQLEREAAALTASLGNVGKTAQATTAGTDAAAAATKRWAQSLAESGNPIGALNAQLERLKAAQVAGVITAQEYRDAIAGVQAKAAQLGGSIEAQRAAQERAAASAKAAADSQRQWALSLATAADPMARLNAELAELARLQASGTITAREYAAAAAAIQQKAAGIEGSIEGQARAMAKQAAESDRAANATREWAASLATAAAPLSTIEAELTRLANAQREGVITADAYGNAIAGVQQRAATMARDFPGLVSSIEAHTAATTKAAGTQETFVRTLLETADPMVRINRLFDELKAASASGAASTEEYARAFQYLQSQAKAAGGQLGQLSAVGRGADRSMRGTSAAATNLVQQIQDIGIVAAMGQDPLTVMIQQGSQIAAVMGPMGASGALKTFQGALTQLINPMTILSFAAVYLGTVLFQSFLKGHESAEQMEKAAKKTKDEIKELAKAFPDLEKAISSMERTAVTSFALILSKSKAMAAQLPQEIKNAFKIPELGGEAPFLGIGETKTIPNTIEQLEALAKSATEDIPAATQRLDEFFKMLAANEPNAGDIFKGMIGAFDQVKPGIARFGGVMVDDANKMAQAVDDLEAQLKTAAGGSAELENILRQTVGQMHEGTFSARDLEKQLTELWLTTDKANKAERDRILAMIAANDAAARAEEQRDAIEEGLRVEQQRLEMGALAWARYTQFMEESTEASKRSAEAMQSLKDAAVPDLSPLQELFRLRDEALAGAAKGQESTITKDFEAAVRNLTDLTPELALAQEQQNEAMERTNEIVTLLTSAYPELTNVMNTATAASGEQQSALSILQEQIAAQQAVLANASMGLSNALADAGGKFAPFQSAIDSFNQSVAAGKPNIEGFQQAVQQIMAENPTPEVKALGAELLNLSNIGASAQGVINQLNAIISFIGPTALAQLPGIDGLIGKLGELTAAQAQYNSSLAVMQSLGQPTLSGLEQNAKAHEDINQQLKDGKINIEQWGKANAENAAAAARLTERQNEANKAGLETLEQSLFPEKARQAEIKKTTELLEANNVPLAEREEILARINAKYDTKGGKGGGGKGGGGGTAAAIDENRQWVESQLDAADSTRAVQRELDKLNQLYAQGALTMEEYEIISKHLGEQMKDTANDAKEAYDAAATFANIMDQWGQQVASSLADAIVEGENLEDVFKDLLKQLLKMIIQMMILEPLMKSIMGSFGGMGGGGMGGFPMMMMGGAGGGGSWAPPGWFGRAANQNTRAMNALLRGGAVESRGTGTVVANSSRTSMGNMIINFGMMGGGKGSGVINGAQGDDERATKFAKRVRDLVQTEMVRQQRPGGILWGAR